MPSSVRRLQQLKQELPEARYNKLTSRFYASRSQSTFYLSTKSWRERELVVALAREHDLYCTSEAVFQPSYFCNTCERLWVSIIDSETNRLKYNIQYDTVCPSCKKLQHCDSLDLSLKTGRIWLSKEPRQPTRQRQKPPKETIDDWMQYVKRINCNKTVA